MVDLRQSSRSRCRDDREQNQYSVINSRLTVVGKNTLVKIIKNKDDFFLSVTVRLQLMYNFIAQIPREFGSKVFGTFLTWLICFSRLDFGFRKHGINTMTIDTKVHHNIQWQFSPVTVQAVKLRPTVPCRHSLSQKHAHPSVTITCHSSQVRSGV